MPELDYCSCCGTFTVVHGNKGEFGRRIMLCDNCCPCHNHSPYLGRPWAGKYYSFSMLENWYHDSMISLLTNIGDKKDE